MKTPSATLAQIDTNTVQRMSKVILPRQNLPMAEAEATPNKVQQIVFDGKVFDGEESESPVAEITDGSLEQT